MAGQQQALDLLVRSARNAIELGDQVGHNTGLLGVLRERLESARDDFLSHARTNPLEKHRTRRKAERLLAATVEYVNEAITSLTDKR